MLSSETKRRSDSRVGCYTDTHLVGCKCTNCNWWYVKVECKTDDDEDYLVRYDDWLCEGAICALDYELWRKPLQLVGHELDEYRRSLSTLKPRDVEILVGQLLSQYQKCDVRHVGRANDKGIDLIGFRGDSIGAVQVKHRRMDRKLRSESIAAVR